MKALWGIFGLMAVLGIVYGLAFVGNIPVKKLAAKSPALAKTLIALHLAKPNPKAAVMDTKLASSAAVPSPEQQALDTQKRQIAGGAHTTGQGQGRPGGPAAGAGRSPLPRPRRRRHTPAGHGRQLIALYGTMDADAVAQVFASCQTPWWSRH